jgi:hypothetical protein
VRVGDETFHVTRSGFVFYPRDVPHRLTVESAEVRLLTLVTPGGIERLWQEIRDPAPTRTLPEPVEPDLDRALRLVTQYGAELLPS